MFVILPLTHEAEAAGVYGVFNAIKKSSGQQMAESACRIRRKR